MVHESISETFITKLTQAVENLKMGLPWDKGVNITPLPEESKPVTFHPPYQPYYRLLLYEIYL